MASERVEGVDPVAGAAAAPGAPEEAGEGLAAEAVVALCQALGPAQYDQFVGELSAAPDTSQAAAVVRRWTALVRAKARRRAGTGGRGGPAADSAESASTEEAGT